MKCLEISIQLKKKYVLSHTRTGDLYFDKQYLQDYWGNHPFLKYICVICFIKPVDGGIYLTKTSIAAILPAFNEEISIGSIVLCTSQHANRAIVIDDGFTDRTARAEGSEITVRPIRKEPQIHSPPEELSACYARGRAGNADERRYMKPPSAFICVHPRLIPIVHYFMEVPAWPP